MTQRIRIKRSTTKAVPANLAFGELAFSSNGSVLYIGSSNGASVAIGGYRNPGVLTANQALVANSSGFIDQIKTITLTTNKIKTAVGVGTAGQVLISRGANNVEWGTVGDDSNENLVQYITTFTKDTTGANDYILVYPIINNLTLPVNFANSLAYTETVATTTNQIFGIFNGSNNVGNVKFTTGSTNGVFTNCEFTSYVVGNILKIKQFSNADSTFSNFSISIKFLKETP